MNKLKKHILCVILLIWGLAAGISCLLFCVQYSLMSAIAADNKNYVTGYKQMTFNLYKDFCVTIDKSLYKDEESRNNLKKKSFEAVLLNLIEYGVFNDLIEQDAQFTSTIKATFKDMDYPVEILAESEEK